MEYHDWYKKAELRYIAGELELVAESLAELADAIGVYEKRDGTSKDIYDSVEDLRAEAFELHDRVATLAERES